MVEFVFKNLTRFLAFVVICSTAFHSEQGDDKISISIEIRTPDNESRIETFTHKALDGRIEYAVANFCEENQVLNTHCKEFFHIADTKAKAKRKEILTKNAINVNDVDTELGITHFLVPNSHMLRHPASIQSEITNKYNEDNSTEKLLKYYSDETRVINQIVLHLSSIKNRSEEPHRLGFIHSCSLSETQSFDILEDIIRQIRDSKLISNLEKVFVLNYGHSIPTHFQQAHSDEQIVFLQVSDSISYFEVPTMRLMHTISRYLIGQVGHDKTQVLYLHTKGVSYVQQYQHITDWRNLMLYYLVEQHESCYHLLRSGQFDTIGVNYFNNNYPGNFWWATAHYLATLPQMNVVTSKKYDAEKWLFKSPKIRMFATHHAAVDHNFSEFPRVCYAEDSQREFDDTPESRVIFFNMCQKELPNFKPLPALSFDSEGNIAASDDEVDEYPNNIHSQGIDISRKRSSAWCMGMEKTWIVTE